MGLSRFKTSKPICLIFVTLQHWFVLNTSVNSILSNFITPVASPSDKGNNSVFHLQNQVRPLHSNAHIFKIPAPVCIIFGKIEQRDILNMTVTSFSSIAYYRVMPPGESHYSVITVKKWLCWTFLASWLSPNFSKTRLHEYHCII